ncbi:hypothetical protein ACFQ1I_34820 [Kitasatospora arboriphila]
MELSAFAPLDLGELVEAAAAEAGGGTRRPGWRSKRRPGCGCSAGRRGCASCWPT